MLNKPSDIIITVVVDTILPDVMIVYTNTSPCSLFYQKGCKAGDVLNRKKIYGYNEIMDLLKICQVKEVISAGQESGQEDN